MISVLWTDLTGLPTRHHTVFCPTFRISKAPPVLLICSIKTLCLLVSIDVIPPLDDDHLVVAEDAHPHVGLLLLGVGELVGVGGGGEPKPVPAVSAFGAV